MPTRKNLIMVPYAEIPSMETGSNVALKRNRDRKDIYLKNCCVSLVTAKRQNPECTVALVTNIDVPLPYAGVLEREGVEVISLPFERFNFGDGYTWGLAFYKICTRYYAAHQLDYDRILCLDSDVYVQSGLQAAWGEMDTSILLYRFVGNDSEIPEEIRRFTGAEKAGNVRYGGEFIGASRELMRALTEREEEVFLDMKAREFRVSTGDEFITTLAAEDFDSRIGTAGGRYVTRLHTAAFRRIDSNYPSIPCLHMVSEKWTGMTALYDRYISRNRIPDNKTACHLLHIDHRSPREAAKYLVKKALGKI